MSPGSFETTMITAGIDCGAKTTKVVVIQDGKIIGRGAVPTGFDQVGAAQECLEKAIQAAGISKSEIERICGTGSGRNYLDLALSRVNDVRAISRAARYFFADAGTVVDVGAEESRVARINEEGNPIDFAVGGRCAAGAGSYIEAMARALEVELEEIGPLSLEFSREIPLNTQCAIFGESEVVGLIHAQVDKRDISRAIHLSLASRLGALIQRIGVKREVVLFGGVGRNSGLAEALKKELGLDTMYITGEPEYGAAVGAAILAAEEA